MKLLLVLLLSIPSFAADFPGGSADEEFAKGFSESKGMTAKDDAEVNRDKLKIGGELWAEYQYIDLDTDDYSASPLTLNLYLDSQLRKDVRAFFRGRFVHDATIDENIPSPFTGQLGKRDLGYLEELKISFNLAKTVFWTVGKQKIKWGASHIWNPTDFLNSERRDFLRQEDLRTGLSLIKAHIPVGQSNFYVIGSTENANETDKTGGAVRAEIPFSFGEWTASAFTQKNAGSLFGTDLSIAVWDFDVYAEGAQDDRGYDQSVSGGISYSFKYSDEDMATVGFESFWQENGTTDASQYNGLALNGDWEPFYIGQFYTSLILLLPNPGSWNNSTFSLYGIRNNNDDSSYARVTWAYTGATDMTWNVGLGVFAGHDNSEMKFFGQNIDGYVQVKVAF